MYYSGLLKPKESGNATVEHVYGPYICHGGRTLHTDELYGQNYYGTQMQEM